MNQKSQKFMKPGDDPELDRAINELRFDSAIYQPLDYDVFGQRRRSSGPGARRAQVDTPPAVESPAGPRADRAWRRKALVSAGAVLAVLLPLLVQSALVKRGRSRSASVPASATGGLSPMDSPRLVTTPEPREPPAAMSASPAPTSPASAASVEPARARVQSVKRKKPDIAAAAVAPGKQVSEELVHR